MNLQNCTRVGYAISCLHQSGFGHVWDECDGPEATHAQIKSLPAFHFSKDADAVCRPSRAGMDFGQFFVNFHIGKPRHQRSSTCCQRNQPWKLFGWVKNEPVQALSLVLIFRDLLWQKLAIPQEPCSICLSGFCDGSLMRRPPTKMALHMALLVVQMLGRCIWILCFII